MADALLKDNKGLLIDGEGALDTCQTECCGVVPPVCCTCTGSFPVANKINAAATATVSFERKVVLRSVGSWGTNVFTCSEKVNAIQTLTCGCAMDCLPCTASPGCGKVFGTAYAEMFGSGTIAMIDCDNGVFQGLIDLEYTRAVGYTCPSESGLCTQVYTQCGPSITCNVLATIFMDHTCPNEEPYTFALSMATGRCDPAHDFLIYPYADSIPSMDPGSVGIVTADTPTGGSTLLDTGCNVGASSALCGWDATLAQFCACCPCTDGCFSDFYFFGVKQEDQMTGELSITIDNLYC